MYTETKRVPHPSESTITYVQRIGNGSFENVKEIKTTTTEIVDINNELHTTEIITINRYISKVSDFPL